jgi:hypothetical protein
VRAFLAAALAVLASCTRPEPKPPPADSDAQPCSTAADCTGMLPHLCRACADGGSECARWTCLIGSCAVSLCGEAQPSP